MEPYKVILLVIGAVLLLVIQQKFLRPWAKRREQEYEDRVEREAAAENKTPKRIMQISRMSIKIIWIIVVVSTILGALLEFVK